ncbi:outer membrane protein assembly factor BamB family protein [Dinghuibacter silviterrae]|uniref:Outer membrane protein assembly factor BamB n=1 Tax=Dinghuibacter silviterrae TaxID=1539049 RepID=A0A4R8DIP9_9BACT|nr:PQQ-binding-like beta-propeller repeat protein [Dinghuibacter silviterrae]TDW97623.1 outer membrane protein assembly factor BamB [Dinghuibacter silviterrae]
MRILLASAVLLLLSCNKNNNHPSSDKYIISFTFTAAANQGLTRDIGSTIGADSVLVAVPMGTNLNGLVPTITYKGAKITPASGQSENFSAPVTYVVTAQDGSTQSYVVTVRFLSNAKAITSFAFRPTENPGLTATIQGIISGDTIVVPFSSDLPLDNLTPYITYTGVSISPSSGTKADFTSSQRYLVTAEDGSMAAYTVFVSTNLSVFVGSDDGYVYAIDAATGLQRWKFATGGAIDHGPTVSNGTVFVGSTDGYLYAINAANGSLLWKYDFYEPVYSYPTVTNGVVFMYGNATMTALDAQTGAVKWQFVTQDLKADVLDANPTVANGLVYFSLFEGYASVVALNVATGNPVWTYYNGSGYSNPAAVGGTVYAADQFCKIVAMDANTGAVKWRYYDGTFGSGTSPTVSGSKVFIAGYDNYMYAFDTASGSVLWKSGPYGGGTSGQFSSPVTYNGAVYAGNNDGAVYAFDMQTGNVLWTSTNPVGTLPSISEVTIAHGILYYGTSDGSFVAVDLASHATKWSFHTNGIISDGPCVIDAGGATFHPGVSGDQQ